MTDERTLRYNQEPMYETAQGNNIREFQDYQQNPAYSVINNKPLFKEAQVNIFAFMTACAISH